MPYSSIDQMPDYTKKYTATLRRQMLHVFNSVYTKVLKETGSTKEAEKRAFMAMHSVLNKRMEKHGAYGINTRDDMFSFLVDKLVKNI